MRKIIIACVLAFALTGCAGQFGKIQDVIAVTTTNVQNPVTKKSLYQFENAMVVAFVGLNSYKRACVAKAIPQSCKTTIAKLQVYTRKIPGVLRQVRAFVKNNDQVSAITAFNTAKALLAEFKSVAAANNVKVQ